MLIHFPILKEEEKFETEATDYSDTSALQKDSSDKVQQQSIVPVVEKVIDDVIINPTEEEVDLSKQQMITDQIEEPENEGIWLLIKEQ